MKNIMKPRSTKTNVDDACKFNGRQKLFHIVVYVLKFANRYFNQTGKSGIMSFVTQSRFKICATKSLIEE